MATRTKIGIWAGEDLVAALDLQVKNRNLPPASPGRAGGRARAALEVLHEALGLEPPADFHEDQRHRFEQDREARVRARLAELKAEEQRLQEELGIPGKGEAQG